MSAQGSVGPLQDPGLDRTPVEVTTSLDDGPMHERGRYERLPRREGLARAKRYLLVTKPRIIELLLITTVPAMIVAAGAWPGTWVVVATLFGGALSAGGANAINNYFDRDIDQLMRRTKRRPTARDEVSPRGALTLGVTLGVAGLLWLGLLVNWLAAVLATSALLFYVFVYTIGMKRRTDQAVVIGGAAGCVPVLTGWAAVTGDLADPRPWLLFALIFWWTPPHFWALAFKYREDYARAGLPMLPVTRGPTEAGRQILLHSYLLLSVVLLYIAGAQTGWIFAGTSLVLTAIWLVLAHRLHREGTVKAAMTLFHYSTSYLAAVFLAAAVDALV